MRITCFVSVLYRCIDRTKTTGQPPFFSIDALSKKDIRYPAVVQIVFIF